MRLDRRAERHERQFWQLVVVFAFQACHAAQGAPQAAAAEPATLLLGRVRALAAGCGSAGGGANATLIAEDLPASYGSQPVACKFVPWSALEEAGAEWLQGDTSNATVQLSLLRDLATAPSTPATLRPLEYLGATADTSRQFRVTCRIPSTLPTSGSGLVLVSAATRHPGDGLVVVAAGERLTQTSIESFEPLLGPATGGTRVYIRGTNLPPAIVCTFSNATASVNVTARATNSSVATCAAPAWHVGLRRVSQAVTLSAVAGVCVATDEFEFYAEPEVTGVFPLRGPRYGSFELRVDLGESLGGLAAVERDGLSPIVRISGADLNGSDLVLAANFSEDRRSLTAETPIERTPLLAGQHRVHVSLNGQQYAGDQAVGTETMLNVGGPSVFMTSPQYGFPTAAQAGGAAEIPVRMSATLLGMSTLPVTANLSVSERFVGQAGLTVDVAGSAPLRLRLSAEQLRWEAGESGQREFTLFAGGSVDRLARGAALVRLATAENADVTAQNATSVVSQLTAAQLSVGFSIQPNQVAYRGENATIPVDVSNAALRVPAAVSYEILSYADAKRPTYIPDNFSAGVIEWDLDSGAEALLEIPIDWGNVTLETEDHLMVILTPAWNSRVVGPQNHVGLHVFGVDADQCPPGTYRYSTPAPPPPAPQVQSGARAGAPPATAGGSGWLESILVYGGGGLFLDLSSQFTPDVPEYGVIVPADFANATLCVEPYDATAEITVRNASGTTLSELGRAVTAASLHTFGMPAPGSGRRLAGQSLAVPIPGPAGARSSVHALGSWGDVNATACDAGQWLLPLVQGRNDFSIGVGGVGAAGTLPPPSSASNASHPPDLPAGANASAAASLAPVASGSGMYTLSVVRLADLAHAQLSTLNVTESDRTYPVCSDVPLADSSDWLEADVPPCVPEEVMRLNVSYETDVVSLHPGLRYPSVQGLRVEVAGQVLSQGGNVGADQLVDTAAVNTVRENTDFLPAAFVVGLQPNVPVEVPIVVVAEDSVTSLRYVLSITRLPGGSDNDTWDIEGDTGLGAFAPLAGSAVSVGSAQPDETVPGVVTNPFHVSETEWPVPPSRQPDCGICPAGWATTEVDQGHCEMCTPGRFARGPQSPECAACQAGTYADSWGSTHCNHCIIGTYAPRQGSRLCFMCPENMTNLEDGSDGCSVPVRPGTNLLMRYAVIVSFGVYLNGTSLDEIAAKVGVNASSVIILKQLIRSDTAAAFNITSRDVNVTGVSQVSRRVLMVNVTVTLGVDLPTNSSQGDINAELAVKNLSADDAIDMLSTQPDRFLGRTTKALDVTAEPGATPPTRVESFPPGARRRHALPWYGILLLCLGAVSMLALAARIWRKRSRRLYNSVVGACLPSGARRSFDTAEGARPLAATDSLAGARPAAAAGLTARGSRNSDRELMLAGSELSDAPSAE